MILRPFREIKQEVMGESEFVTADDLDLRLFIISRKRMPSVQKHERYVRVIDLR
jgi:hypothetical protein